MNDDDKLEAYASTPDARGNYPSDDDCEDYARELREEREGYGPGISRPWKEEE